MPPTRELTSIRVPNQLPHALKEVGVRHPERTLHVRVEAVALRTDTDQALASSGVSRMHPCVRCTLRRSPCMQTQAWSLLRCLLAWSPWCCMLAWSPWCCLLHGPHGVACWHGPHGVACWHGPHGVACCMVPMVLHAGMVPVVLHAGMVPMVLHAGMVPMVLLAAWSPWCCLLHGPHGVACWHGPPLCCMLAWSLLCCFLAWSPIVLHAGMQRSHADMQVRAADKTQGTLSGKHGLSRQVLGQQLWMTRGLSKQGTEDCPGEAHRMIVWVRHKEDGSGEAHKRLSG